MIRVGGGGRNDVVLHLRRLHACTVNANHEPASDRQARPRQMRGTGVRVLSGGWCGITALQHGNLRIGKIANIASKLERIIQAVRWRFPTGFADTRNQTIWGYDDLTVMSIRLRFAPV
jgi:hypothetical protein